MMPSAVINGLPDTEAAARRPASVPIVCSVPGVTAASPLAQSLQKIVGQAFMLVFDNNAAAGPARWRRAVAGTGLQWFAASTPDNAAPRASDPDIILDLFGTAPSSRQVWHMTVDGAPLLQPFAALSICHRPPFIASVVLSEHTSDDAVVARADANISSRLPYRHLLHRLADIAGLVLRAAFLNQSGDRPGPVAGAGSSRPAITKERLRLATATVADRWRSRMRSESWAVGELQCSVRELLNGRMPSVSWIVTPDSGGNFADPFPWPGRPGAILCELYERQSGRGEIVVIDPQRRRPEQLDLGLRCHLSYPFTWTEPDGRHFCVPESSAARQTIIYELDPAGTARRYSVVDTRRAIGDPTVFRHAGFYWLAYCDADLGSHDTLCLLYANQLAGPWTPHRLNPVKIDVRSARPGGTPFLVDGALFRPAQDCSQTYGGALVINRIDVCSPDAYAETPVMTLRPDPAGPYPDGMHTLSIDGDRLLVDGKRLTTSPATLLRKLGARLRRGA